MATASRAAHAPSSSGLSLHGVVLAGLYLAGFVVLAAIALRGSDFYRTPLVERAHHEGYWQWKAGGSIGHKLGIAGSSMMVLMLLYSVRKRVGLLRRAGPLRLWLDGHIFLGVFGPLLVVLHSTLQGAGPRGAELLVDDRRGRERCPRPLPLPPDPAHTRRRGARARGARGAGPRALRAPAHALRPRRGAARRARRDRRGAAAHRARRRPVADPRRRPPPAVQAAARSPGAAAPCRGPCSPSSSEWCARRRRRAAGSCCGTACTSSSTTGTCCTSRSRW